MMLFGELSSGFVARRCSTKSDVMSQSVHLGDENIHPDSLTQQLRAAWAVVETNGFHPNPHATICLMCVMECLLVVQATPWEVPCDSAMRWSMVAGHGIPLLPASEDPPAARHLPDRPTPCQAEGF